jgi:hypothetical protein
MRCREGTCFSIWQRKLLEERLLENADEPELLAGHQPLEIELVERVSSG